MFTIDGKTYFIPKENYVISHGWVVQLGIMTHPTMDFWILGLNFFSNYYTIFDQEKKKVGFAINKNANPRIA